MARTVSEYPAEGETVLVRVKYLGSNRSTFDPIIRHGLKFRSGDMVEVPLEPDDIWSADRILYPAGRHIKEE